jgi:hemoglobin
MSSEPGSDKDVSTYGDGDASFQAAGGEEGIRLLANAFYDAMEQLPEAAVILKMHMTDLEVSRDKLARFLCGWLGGPKLFSEKYGPIKIPKAHSHLDIGSEERDAWLKCMEQALSEQPYAESFKRYMLKELFTPADRSRTHD